MLNLGIWDLYLAIYDSPVLAPIAIAAAQRIGADPRAVGIVVAWAPPLHFSAHKVIINPNVRFSIMRSWA